MILLAAVRLFLIFVSCDSLSMLSFPLSMQDEDVSPDGDYDMAEEDPSEGEGEFEEDFDLAS